MSNTIAAQTTAVVVATRSTKALAEKYVASFADCVAPGEWRVTKHEGKHYIVRKPVNHDYSESVMPFTTFIAVDEEVFA